MNNGPRMMMPPQQQHQVRGRMPGPGMPGPPMQPGPRMPGPPPGVHQMVQGLPPNAVPNHQPPPFHQGFIIIFFNFRYQFVSLQYLFMF